MEALSMERHGSSKPDEVEQLLLNARLRDDLEPYLDDSVTSVNTRHLSTASENEFLASMLAWERAPILPISQWFEPAYDMPAPDTLDGDELHQRLWAAIQSLYEKRIVLDFADHLNDRELYTMIYRDILPSAEKKVDIPRNFLHWNCADAGNNPDVWLRYYASVEEREGWAEETNEPLPRPENPPHVRKMPSRPL